MDTLVFRRKNLFLELAKKLLPILFLGALCFLVMLFQDRSKALATAAVFVAMYLVFMILLFLIGYLFTPSEIRLTQDNIQVDYKIRRDKELYLRYLLHLIVEETKAGLGCRMKDESGRRVGFMADYYENSELLITEMINRAELKHTGSGFLGSGDKWTKS